MNGLTQQLERLRLYIKKQLNPFVGATFWSPLVFKEGATIAFWWVMPAMISVWLITRYKEYLPFAYLDAAISDGIGPHLWNVVGMLGLAFFGLAVLIPRCKLIADSAYQVLANTCSMGWLACGLLLGLLTARIPAELSKLALWKARLLEAGLAAFMFEIFALNCLIWWLANLMRLSDSDDGFLRRVERFDLRLRFLVFICLSILPTVSFVIRGK